MIFYKGIMPDGTDIWGNGRWDLPKNNQPGRWRTIRGSLKSGINGFHACTKDQIIGWIALFNMLSYSVDLYETEFQGKILFEKEQVIGSKARLIRRIGSRTTD